MSKNFFAPVKMESQFVATKLHGVFFQSAGVDAPVEDGTVAVLGDFASDPVYSNVDINTRIATVPADATAMGVGVVDIAGVQQRGDVRLGVKTIGLQAAEGVPVRFRTLVKDDTFNTSEENCTKPLTEGKYAILAVGDDLGKWAPSDTIPVDGGACCKVIKKYVVSQGTDGDVSKDGVTAYMLLVIKN